MPAEHEIEILWFWDRSVPVADEPRVFDPFLEQLDAMCDQHEGCHVEGYDVEGDQASILILAEDTELVLPAVKQVVSAWSLPGLAVHVDGRPSPP